MIETNYARFRLLRCALYISHTGFWRGTGGKTVNIVAAENTYGDLVQQIASIHATC